MSILYDWYENPKETEEGKKGLHPRPCYNGKLTTEQVAARIHAGCTLTRGDILAVLQALSEVLGNELREGRQVYLRGIGYFRPTLKVDTPIDSSMNLRERSRHVAFKDVAFRMDKQLKAAIGPVQLTATRHALHSHKLTDEEVESRLLAYFGEHEVLTRRTFQSLCNLTASTAVLRLRALREAGKLKNIGTRTQPMYIRGEALG